MMARHPLQHQGRHQSRHQKPRFPAVLGFVVVVLAMNLAACSGDAFVTSRGDVDDANEMLAAGDYEGALAAYDALQSRNPRIAFNRGLALYHLGRWDEAVEAFDEARGSKDPAMKASSYYHIGNVHARKALDAEEAGDKDGALVAWKDAVAAYENALLIDPDHQDAKYQLEVALFRVDPPCRLRNDALEPNNLFADAKPLELTPVQEKDAAPGERRVEQALWLCPDDEDWLVLPLEPGDRVTAKVARSEGPEHAKAGISLWAPDGKTRVVPEGAATPDETLPETVELAGAQSAGEYRLRVTNPRGDDFGAKLNVSVRPACVRTEDEHEPNESLAAAKVLEPGEVPLRMCPGGHDWFQVSVGEGESLKVTAQVQATSGELKLTVTDAAGQVLGEGVKGEQDSVVALAYGRPAGPVFIHASGDDETEAVYLLKTEVIPVCPEREDDKEDNDTIETASGLTPGDHDGLQLCPNDPDYFAVEVKAGESIVAHLSAEPLAGVPTLEVLQADGTVLGRGFPLEGGLLAMALDPGAGRYYVKVGGEADATYDLKLEVLPPCPEGNDKDEPNDVANDAKLLEPPEPPQQQGEKPKVKRKLLRICPGDQDWFRVPVTPESSLLIAGIEFVHDKGDLELVEYEADGETRVAESNKSESEKNAEAVVVPPPEARIPDPTDYLLRISGVDAETENFYLLTLQELPPQGENGQQNQDQNQDQQENQDQNDQQQQNQDDQQQQQQQQQQEQEEQPRPDRSTMEKEMEREDGNDHRNLEAERARQRVRHLPPPLKDW